MLLSTVVVGLMFLVAGLPLTVFLGACGGLVWVWLNRVPGWFFVVAAMLCSTVFVYAQIWSSRLDESDPQIVLTGFMWFNAVVALPALLFGWFVQRKSGRPGSIFAARPLLH